MVGLKEKPIHSDWIPLDIFWKALAKQREALSKLFTSLNEHPPWIKAHRDFRLASNQQATGNQKATKVTKVWLLTEKNWVTRLERPANESERTAFKCAPINDNLIY